MTAFDRVLGVVATLPGASVEEIDRHHKLVVRRKTFGWHVVDHHGDGREALHLRAPAGASSAMVERDPDRYFLPPYLASRGYVGVYLDLDEVDWDDVADLLADAHRLAGG
jgi:hypothetical protein